MKTMMKTLNLDKEESQEQEKIKGSLLQEQLPKQIVVKGQI